MATLIPNHADKPATLEGAQAYMEEVDSAISKLSTTPLIGGHADQGAAGTSITVLPSRIFGDYGSIQSVINSPLSSVNVTASPLLLPRIDRVALSISGAIPVYITGVEGSGVPPAYPDFCMPVASVLRYPSDAGKVGAGQLKDERCRLDMFSGRVGADFTTTAKKMECYPTGFAKAFAVSCKYEVGGDQFITFVPPPEARFMRLTVAGAGGGAGGGYINSTYTTFVLGGGGGGGALETFMCVAQTLTIHGGERGLNGVDGAPGTNTSIAGSNGSSLIINGSKGFKANVAGGKGGALSYSNLGGAGGAGGIAAYGGITGEAGNGYLSTANVATELTPTLLGRSGLIASGGFFGLATIDIEESIRHCGGGGQVKHEANAPYIRWTDANHGCVFVEWL